MNKTDPKKKQNVKSDNFCYHKVGRAITKWRIEKGRVTILIGYPDSFYIFWGTNNIFVNCKCIRSYHNCILLFLFIHLQQTKILLVPPKYCKFSNIAIAILDFSLLLPNKLLLIALNICASFFVLIFTFFAVLFSVQLLLFQLLKQQ